MKYLSNNDYSSLMRVVVSLWRTCDKLNLRAAKEWFDEFHPEYNSLYNVENYIDRQGIRVEEE